MNKTVIGVGQVGSRLASLYTNDDDVLLTFNTDHRDIGGISLGNDTLITNGGAGQNYSKGLKIWHENKEKLEKYLEPIHGQNIVYFVSAGGGSGSSSVITFLNILLRQNNNVLLVVSLPYLKESIPATSNATRLLSRVAEFSNDMSAYIVSVDDLSKQVGTSFQSINETIVERTRLITDLVDYHNDDYYTPFAIDEGDHSSVAYSGGFMNISHQDLEEEFPEKIKMPKFSYGNIREASNILIAKNIPTTITDEETVAKMGDDLITCSIKIANSAKSARVIHGVIRTGVDFPYYTTLATGLSIDKVFEKLRGKATDSALRHTEKIKTKSSKILERDEDKMLDV